MRKVYHAASAKWNDLPAWNTFRQAVAPNSKRGMKGFRVSKLPLTASRARLQKEALPELSEVSCKWLAPAECCGLHAIASFAARLPPLPVIPRSACALESTTRCHPRRRRSRQLMFRLEAVRCAARLTSSSRAVMLIARGSKGARARGREGARD